MCVILLMRLEQIDFFLKRIAQQGEQGITWNKYIAFRCLNQTDVDGACFTNGTLHHLIAAVHQRMKTAGVFHYVNVKIPETSVVSQMERFISISSDWNIRYHLWRWSTYFGRTGPTEICRSINFWQTGSLLYLSSLM